MSKLGHCREREHWACGGWTIDPGDNSQVDCTCPCHRPGPESPYDTLEERDDAHS